MKYLASFTLLLAIFAFCTAEILAQNPVITRVEVIYNGATPQTLNIYGSNFINLTHVRLDGTLLTVTGNTGTMITANTTPQRVFGPGMYLLRLTIVSEPAATFNVTIGAQGPAGPAGTPGPAGQPGVVSVAGFSGGPVLGIPGGVSAFVFAGQTATVTTTETQRLVGSAVADLGASQGAGEVFGYGLCYQPAAGGNVTSFSGDDYMYGQKSIPLQSFAAAATVVPGAGTWKIGFCVINSTSAAVNITNTVNGWVMVVN